jgi:hypothetical protein
VGGTSVIHRSSIYRVRQILSCNFESDFEFGTCRRLKSPIRDYLGSILPGLANFPINPIAELALKSVNVSVRPRIAGRFNRAPKRLFVNGSVKQT